MKKSSVGKEPVSALSCCRILTLDSLHDNSASLTLADIQIRSKRVALATKYLEIKNTAEIKYIESGKKQ